MEGLYGKELDGVYRIDELVGRGGIGAVFKARDTSLDRDVAIKVLHPHFADDPDFRARFLQEARAVASLDHPDIVRVYAFGQDLGMLYIVMDLITGQTLQAWLKRLADEHKIVALSDGLTIAQRLSRALHYAHEEGVLHRDVKPANILLKPIAAALREPDDMPFRPVLTDFGLAKLAEGGLHTQTGATMGTPAYMSPEQCLGLPPDRRSDIYSLGVILFELTTGRVPFEVKSLTDAIRRHTQEPPPPPRSINPDLPVVVENIVLRALAKRQQDRYANAREMADDLRQAIHSSSSNLHVAPVLTAEELAPGLQTRMDGVSGHAITDPSMPAASLRLFPPGSALTVVAANGQSRRVPLDNRHDLSIGRGEENDLRLPDGRASRLHARIEYEAGSVSIVDLRSTNGTMVGDSRLLPGVAVPWPPGKPLLIGSSRLQLELGQPLAAPVILPVSPGGETVAGDPFFAAQEAEHIGVSAESFALTVEPGGSVSTSFTVMNQGPIVDHFETSVAGIPGEWVPALPPVIRLLPNESHAIEVTIRPPRSPQSQAGRYPVTIRVTSQAAPGQVAAVRGTLTLSAFYALGIALAPQKQTGVVRGEFEVRLENGGNAPLTVGLEAVDPEEACLYTFTPNPAIIPAAQSGRARLEVRPRIPLAANAQRLYPFTVTARPVESPELTRSAQGQWSQITPTFEIGLRPQRQSGTGGGIFYVQVRNTSIAELELQLTAADPEDGCTYIIAPSSVSVPAGQEISVRMDVRPRFPLPTETARTYPFTVSARTVGAAGQAQQAQGQWVQIAPAFEVLVAPPSRRGTEGAVFQVRVRNQSTSDLEVELSASDPEGACTYALEPSQVRVPASRDLEVALHVTKKYTLRGKQARPHAITVTARPKGSPRFIRLAHAEWVQMPSQRALWLPTLFGWAAWFVAWFFFFMLQYYVPAGNLLRTLMRMGFPAWISMAAPWALRGVVAGLIGGLGTGIALWWGEPRLGFWRMLAVTVLWGLGWAYGAISTVWSGVSATRGGLFHIVFWAIVGAIVGLVCGALTGLTLRGGNQAVRGGHILLIGLVWAVAWTAGHIVSEWIMEMLVYRNIYGMPPGILQSIALGGIGGGIGMIGTFALFAWARRRAEQ